MVNYVRFDRGSSCSRVLNKNNRVNTIVNEQRLEAQFGSRTDGRTDGGISTCVIITITITVTVIITIIIIILYTAVRILRGISCDREGQPHSNALRDDFRLDCNRFARRFRLMPAAPFPPSPRAAHTRPGPRKSFAAGRTVVCVYGVPSDRAHRADVYNTCPPPSDCLVRHGHI